MEEEDWLLESRKIKGRVRLGWRHHRGNIRLDG